MAYGILFNFKIVSEYDQEIPQSQTADNPFYFKFITRQQFVLKYLSVLIKFLYL